MVVFARVRLADRQGPLGTLVTLSLNGLTIDGPIWRPIDSGRAFVSRRRARRRYLFASGPGACIPCARRSRTRCGRPPYARPRDSSSRQTISNLGAHVEAVDATTGTVITIAVPAAPAVSALAVHAELTEDLRAPELQVIGDARAIEVRSHGPPPIRQFSPSRPTFFLTSSDHAIGVTPVVLSLHRRNCSCALPKR